MFSCVFFSVSFEGFFFFYWVFLDFSGFTGFPWVVPSITGFYRVFQRFRRPFNSVETAIKCRMGFHHGPIRLGRAPAESAAPGSGFVGLVSSIVSNLIVEFNGRLHFFLFVSRLFVLMAIKRYAIKKRNTNKSGSFFIIFFFGILVCWSRSDSGWSFL